MPSNDEVKEYLITATDDLKLVADYTNLNFIQALELDCYKFKEYVRDAFKYNMRKTKEGQDFLEDCWLLTQTKPDRSKLRNNFN